MCDVVAQGYDIKRFLEAMCEKKSKIHACHDTTLMLILESTPNIDYFTRDELRELIKQFK
jgi:hypothetical protein